MKTFAAIWAAISLALIAAPTEAASCRDILFEEISFAVCEADPATETVRLFLNDAEGKPLGTFENVEARLKAEGQTLAFAVNGGMYHPDRRPVGLYVEDGQAISRIVTREGPGNFGLLPNGVLCLTDNSARVIESREFDRMSPNCRYATQSGPMLVIEGELHPRFLPNSSSRFVRNGIGVSSEGTLISAISNQPVNFHQFARLFREVLKTPNALFIDGKVSRIYAPEMNRHDFGFPMGAILGVVVPTD